ncbi:MAG: FtsX-like permease family protein [Treponema sp.]|nr:FtsX-like permease family protein [Treponema sp.]
MFFFLALRNIIRNKKNSLIIALLIGVITFLFFLGNSIIGKADRSFRDAFIDSLTGDVVLQRRGELTMNLFGANIPIIEDFFIIPVLPAYDIAMELAAAESGVAGISSQVSGQALLDLQGTREPALLGGIDADSYFPLFPGIILEEGRLLRSGETGAMITAQRAQRVEAASGRRPAIGDPLLFTSLGDGGFRIREVPLVGIFSYQNPGQFMNEIVLIDPQTVRALNEIQVAGTAEAPPEATSLFDLNLDDLFSMDSFTWFQEEEEFSTDLLQSFLLEEREELSDHRGGDWHFIIIRLEPGVSPSAFIASINRKIEDYGLVAVGWRVAAGTSAILMILIQALFNAGVFLVSVAGVIAIINILLISVFRRTREIGTLRAIGARDSYIRSLIITENLLLSLGAGLLGVIGGAFFIRWLNSLGLHIPNELVASLLGGSTLQLDFLPPVGALSFAAALALGFSASLYPVETAVRIEPMAAVRRG